MSNNKSIQPATEYTNESIARGMRDVATRHGLTKSDVRAGLPHLNDRQFRDLWAGRRVMSLYTHMRVATVIDSEHWTRAAVELVEAQRVRHS